MTTMIRLALLLALVLTLFAPAISLFATGVTVTTDIDSYSLRYSVLRKSFTANGLEWCFYQKTDGNLAFRTSATGNSTWSAETVVRAVVKDQWSVTADAVNIAYVYNTDNHLYWRMGACLGNGSINWYAVEQDIAIGSASAEKAHTTWDSSGNPWILYDYDGTILMAIKSDGGVGTWSTAAGFPITIKSGGYPSAQGIYALDSDVMVFIYAKWLDADYLRARAWNGSELLPEKTSTTLVAPGIAACPVSCVQYLDRVGCLFISTLNKLQYVEYTYSTNSFGAEQTLQIGMDSNHAGILCKDISNGWLYAYWEDIPLADHLYDKIKLMTILPDVAWSDYSDDLTSSGFGGVGNSFFCNEVSYGTRGVYYLEGTALHYWPADVSTGAPTGITYAPTDVTSTTAVFNGKCAYDGASSIATATFSYNNGDVTGNISVYGYIHSNDVFEVEASDLVPGSYYRGWIYFENEYGHSYSNFFEFTTLAGTEPVVPTVVTRGTYDVQDTSARLHGYLAYDGEQDCYVGFQYRVQGSPTWLTGWNVMPCAWYEMGPGCYYHTAQDFLADLSSLQTHTTYEFRAIARNALGDATPGATMTFTTSVVPGATPAPTGGVGFGDLIPESIRHYFENWSPMFKMILAVIITVLGMALLAVKLPRAKAGGQVVTAFGGLATVGFIIVGWYPQWILILLGAVVGVLLLLIVLGGRK